ncbi:hypothetical protein [Streptomyces sp. NPDC019224]|uniref:hypothetical protein n=1 Tax=Streptomyces sp. NPDC019224 TaxID=3154484 RepID=UPI0033EAEA89
MFLAVLALLVGAPAVAGAGLPVRATATLAGTHAVSAPGLPVRASTAARSAAPAPVPRFTAPAPVPRFTAPAPVPRSAAPAPAAPARSAAPAPPDAAPAPPATADRGPHTTPLTAVEHPRTAHQLPPPGPGGLAPCPAAVPLPHLAPWSGRTTPVPAAQRLRVALPGVRAPPSAGVHRPRDRFPVPLPTNAVPFPPS